jgi:hypothetical protein
MRGPGPKWREKHGMLGGLHMQVDGSERVISSGGESSCDNLHLSDSVE